MDVIGAAPPALADIQTGLLEAQGAAGGEKADADHIYDVPVELAKALTGFRHDEDTPGVTGEAYHILESAGGARGSKSSLGSKFMSMFRGRQ